MFEEGVWVVRATADASYGLDCTPERADGTTWRAQLTVYRDQDGEITAHTAVARALVFDTAREAAEVARAYGERWVAEHIGPRRRVAVGVQLAGLGAEPAELKLS
jgi:hypothetical protein